MTQASRCDKTGEASTPNSHVCHQQPESTSSCISKSTRPEPMSQPELQQRTLALLQASRAEEREKLGTGTCIIYIFMHFIYNNDSFHLSTCQNKKPACHHSKCFFLSQFQQISPPHMRFVLNVNHFSSSSFSCLFKSPCCSSPIMPAAKLVNLHKVPAYIKKNTGLFVIVPFLYLC